MTLLQPRTCICKSLICVGDVLQMFCQTVCTVTRVESFFLGEQNGCKHLCVEALKRL